MSPNPPKRPWAAPPGPPIQGGLPLGGSFPLDRASNFIDFLRSVNWFTLAG